MTATGNEVVTLNQLKYTKDKLSSAVAAEATEREKQDGILESSIATKLGTQSVIAGNNITITPDDSAHTVTISTTNPGFDPNADPIVIGSEAKGTQTGTITIGKTAKTEQYCSNAVAIGDGAQVYSDGVNSVAMGTNAAVRSSTSIAIGNMSNINDHLTECTALGPYAQCNGQHSLALGSGATTTAHAGNGIAIGFSSEANAYDGIAIGTSSNASGESSVAIGNKSYATEASTVSVGRAATEQEVAIYRRIVNVADPTNAQDATTKNYVDTAINASKPTIATSEKVGIVKPGTGLTVTDDGTLNADTYTLPVATVSTLGGVKIGGGINVASDGTISTSGVNTITVGTTTAGEPGTQASVTNSGTAKDVVLDFSIPTQSFKGAGDDSIAISANGDAESPGVGSIAIGRNAHTDAVSSQSLANYSIAIGSNAAVGHDGSVVIGGNAELRAQGSGGAGVIIGVNARGDRSAISIGASAGNNGISPTQVHGVSIGRNAWAYFERSVALGEGARATASDQYHGCIALGGDATASAIGSVALGEQSKATEPYTVSVGEGVGSGDLPYHVATRRIINVTDPVNAQDAATKAYVDSHAASGGYTLPAATASTLGGVKVGDNLTVSDDGTLAATAYTLPAATATTLGGVKVGSGLAVTSDGVVSARTYGAFGEAYTKIAIGLSSSSGLLCLGADPQSFMQKDLDNDGKRYSLALKPATASTVGGVKIGAGINVAADGTISVPSGGYTLPAATASTLGGVKVGKYLSVANDGTISRDYAEFEISNYALSIADAIFCDEDGNQSDEETGCSTFKDGPLLESSFGAFIKPSKAITINGEFCTFNYSVPNEANYAEKYAGCTTEGTAAIFEILGYKVEEDTGHIQFNKKLIGTGYAESIIEYHSDGKIAVLLYSNELLEANKIYQISFFGKGFSPNASDDSSETEGE